MKPENFEKIKEVLEEEGLELDELIAEYEEMEMDMN